MQKLSFLDFEKLNPIWTDQEILKLCTIMNRKHDISLNEEHFEINAGYNDTQVQIYTCLKKNDSSLEYPVECIFVNENKEKSFKEISGILLDYIDTYWTNYFQEDRDIYISIDWNLHSCEGKEFYLRGFVRQKHLELEANQLLAQFGHGDYDIQPISSET